MKHLIVTIVAFILGVLIGWQFANSQPFIKATRSFQKSYGLSDAKMVEMFSMPQKIRDTPAKEAGPENLPAARYDWLPGSATDFMGRAWSNPFNGDGHELATFRCNQADLTALMARFQSETPGSRWASGRPDRVRLITDDLKSLKFPGSAFPTEKSQSLEFLEPPESNSLFGPHVLIDTKEGRVWYLIIRT